MTTRTPGRPRAFDRDAALEKALVEFWRHGYEATSISTLTAAMGIRPPSLYAAFGDKRALFGECVRRYQERHGALVARALTEEPTAERAIARMLREMAADYTDPSHPPGCLIITATASHGPDCADVAEELRAMRLATRQSIADRIAADVRAGLLPDWTDVTGLATFFAAIVQGMSRQAQDGATRTDLERVAALAMHAWPPPPPNPPHPQAPQRPPAPPRAR
ncbi:TetR/AcrR family transcriptional regulator [Actinomadura miaoliensis]|uniref:TetR/AcrR family transcriptional regulator n=1 Tax=Actinomadura miaoliensis TaxID=430685 RepID=A0ABP7V603_9ACTN